MNVFLFEAKCIADFADYELKSDPDRYRDRISNQKEFQGSVTAAEIKGIIEDPAE